MWEIVDFESCPFSVRYASLAGVQVRGCRICGTDAEPVVHLPNPETETVLRESGPICLDCVCRNRSWYTLAPISPRDVEGPDIGR